MKIHFFTQKRNKFVISFGFLTLLWFCMFSASGQTYKMGTHRTVTGCTGTIYDDGGANGNYGPGRDDTMTIISTDPENNAIKLQLAENMDIFESDTLFFYNGNTAHPDSLIFRLGAQTVSWTNNDNILIYDDIVPPSIIAEIPGSGALTLRFKSAGGLMTLPVTILNPIEQFETKTFNLYDVQLPFTYEGYTFTEAGIDTIYFECDSAFRIVINVTPTDNAGYENLTICDTILPYYFVFTNDTIINGTPVYEQDSIAFNTSGTQLIETHYIETIGNDEYIIKDSSIVVQIKFNSPPETPITLAGYTTTCSNNENLIETIVYTDTSTDSLFWIIENSSDTFSTVINSFYRTYNETSIANANGYYNVTRKNACGESYPRREQLSFYQCGDNFPQEIISGDQTVCNGSTQWYEVIGGSDYNFTWEVSPNGVILTNLGYKIQVLWNTAGEGFVKATQSTSTSNGFKFTISCTAPCQPFSVYFDDENTTPTPHYDTSNLCGIDGFKYIDICPGEPVTFSSYGEYPYHDFSYPQNDASSTFIWKIGDESLEGIGLSEITRTFATGKGYNISLSIQDQRGCISNNVATYRVRTSKNPIKSINLHPICVDSTSTLSVGYNSSNLIQIEPVQDEQIASLAVTNIIFLPDGANCPPYGDSYRSPVTFTSFSPQATISSANDIRFVKINLEHSFIGDLLIKLQCPSNQEAVLLPFSDHGSVYQPTGTWLGEASEIDDSGDGCDGRQYSMGNGWDYCFSNNTDPDLQYIYSTSPNKYLYEQDNVFSHNNPFHGPRNTIKRTIIDTTIKHIIDSTICYVMENDVIVDTIIEYTEKDEKIPRLRQAYRPYQSFFPALNGCPLNGTWYIEVKDNWGSDNGFLFGWELALSPDKLPPIWKYSVGVDTVEWNYNETQLQLTYANDTVLQIRPLIDAAGTYPITFTIIDQYGCEYDTTAELIVNGLPNVMINNQLNGTVNTCMGEAAELVATGGIDYLWADAQGNNDTIVVNSSGQYSVTVTDYNGCENFDTVTVVIRDAPEAVLGGATETCAVNLDITSLDTLCGTIQATGFKIFRDGTLLNDNYPHNHDIPTDVYIDTTATEEREYHYHVVSRYDDIHIPEIGDILLKDGTYVNPTDFEYSSSNPPSGVLFWKNEGSSAIPEVEDNYWVVGLKNISRNRAWGNNIDYPITNYDAVTANQDFNGQMNTDTIIEYTTVSSAANSCRLFDYNNVNTIPLGCYWNLPACGQIDRLHNVLTTVNSSFTTLGSSLATPISPTDVLWTSTEHDANQAFAYNFSSNTPALMGKGTLLNARPITATPLVRNISDTTEYHITFAKPVAEAQAIPRIIPIGGNTTLSVEDTKSYSAGCEPTDYNYEWKDNNGIVVSTQQTLDLENLITPGNFTYTVTIIPNDGCSKGCVSTDSITISVRNIPVVTGQTPICFGDSAVYSTTQGMTEYSWEIENGTIINGAGTSSIYVRWDLETGPSNIEVSFTDVLGNRTDTTVYPVTVKPLPEDKPLSGGGNYCAGETGLTILVENPQGGVYYKVFRGTIAVSNYQTSTTGGSIVFGPFTEEGTYTVRAFSDTYENEYTCEIQLEDEVIIRITPNPPRRVIQSQ